MTAPDALVLPTPGMSTGGRAATAEEASRAFGFPHPRAYAIQLDLMRALFATIEHARIGIFESPTGTGKSLSLACAALTWLEHNMQRSQRGALPAPSSSADHEAAGARACETVPEDDDVPDWVTAHALARERDAAADAERDLSERIARARQLEARVSRAQTGARRALASSAAARPAAPGARKRARAAGAGAGPGGHDDDAADDEQFLVHEDEVNGASDELGAFLGAAGEAVPGTGTDDEGLTPELKALLASYESATSGGSRGAVHASLTRGHTLGPAVAAEGGGSRRDRELEDLLSQETSPQIVFASRTHSQLAQFAAEVRKTRFARHGLRVRPVRRPAPSAPSAVSTSTAPTATAGAGAAPRIQLQLDTEGLPPDKPASDGWAWETLPLRTIALGSRAQLCINDSVRAVGAARGTEAMNERCRDMLTAPAASAGSKRHKADAAGPAPNAHVPPATATAGRAEDETCRCPFAPPATAEGLERTLVFRAHAFAAVRDIEDLAALGRDLGVCPYFASRAAARTAHLVAAPYNLLLADSGGGAGVKVQDNVVLVDEAHNLVDTVLAQHTLTLTLTDAQAALDAAQAYLTRFATRLRGDNEAHVRRLVAALAAIVKATRTWALQAAARPAQTRSTPPITLATSSVQHPKPAPTPRPPTGSSSDLFPPGTRFQPKEAILTASQFVAQMGDTGDLINLAALSRFLHESKLLRKLAGYADAAARRAARAGGPVPARSSLPVLHTLARLLHSLARSDGDGRVLLRVVPPPPPPSGAAGTPGASPPDLARSVSIKYQLLDAGKAFAPTVRAARSVVLAGGTMAPIPPVVAQLFPSDAARVDTLACGHIVPARNVLTSVVATGPAGTRLELTYDRRSDAQMTDEVGRVLLNAAALVPGGMVVFVPSYAVLAGYKARWSATGALAKLAARKALFDEPATSAEVDALLASYAAAVRAPRADTSTHASTRRRGALLFAVVGGKLSEGINFADDLARAVVMLGLPFPPAGSAELQERMRFAREAQRPPSAARAASGSGPGPGPGPGASTDPGRELYMAMCMRAVNQSIGRAIRHANDWAALLLVDARYARTDIQSRLPAWITSAPPPPAGRPPSSTGPAVPAPGPDAGARPTPCGLGAPKSFPLALRDLAAFFMAHR